MKNLMISFCAGKSKDLWYYWAIEASKAISEKFWFGLFGIFEN